jgi:hypothetical protein
VLKYAFRGAVNLDITAATDTDGRGFAPTITSAQSATLTPGLYQWSARVEQSGEVYTIASGTVTVTPNLGTALAGELRSSTEVELDLITKQIQDLMATPIESYAIGQRSAARRALEEATRARGVLIAKLGRERGQAYPTHVVRFSEPR